MIIIKIRFSSVLVFKKSQTRTSHLAVLIWETWQSGPGLGSQWEYYSILLGCWLPPQWKNVKRVCLIIWGQTWSWPSSRDLEHYNILYTRQNIFHISRRIKNSFISENWYQNQKSTIGSLSKLSLAALKGWHKNITAGRGGL